MSTPRPEILLEIDSKTIVLELGQEGKSSVNAKGWDGNRAFSRRKDRDQRRTLILADREVAEPEDRGRLGPRAPSHALPSSY
jgi:hypothetical protein